jgi:hypothetical protein
LAIVSHLKFAEKIADVTRDKQKRNVQEVTVMISRDGIRATGLYLLDVLRTEKTVCYSRFYNDDDETEDMLVQGAMPYMSKVDADEDEDYRERDLREEAHVMLNFAASQLDDLGVVQITFLLSKLIDGEPDFEIALTERGEQILRDGLNFGFRDPDYAISATPASEWLIEMLGASFGDSLSLHEVMEFGESEGEITILDDCGNSYGLGTGSYAWAFEVSLWHHARRGVIMAACKTPEHEELWSRFVNSSSRPSCRPAHFYPEPLWDVPFRLADLDDEAKLNIQHVGRVSTY